MQLARVKTGKGWDFAVRAESGERWTPLAQLDMSLPDTEAVIGRWNEICQRVSAGGAPHLDEKTELACPLVRPGKILAIGLNYMDHIRETGATPPEQPIVFAKYASSLSGPSSPIVVDDFLTQKVDYEAELAVIVGRAARRLSHENAIDHVFGYAVANDVSARDLQKSDAQFSRSKSFDTFCPVGPWISTAEGVDDPQSLGISAEVNGEVRQDSSTNQMLFTVEDLLVYLSSTMTLEPGDVILTGTPPGVGLGRTPPTFLRPGDTVRCAIEGLGSIENRVVADPDARPPVPVVRGQN